MDNHFLKSKPWSPANPRPTARLCWFLIVPVASILTVGAVGWYVNHPLNMGNLCATIRVASRENPPWTLITSLLAGPTVALFWWWRILQKDTELKWAAIQQLPTRFSSAVELFNKPGIVGVGGVYELERIVRESPEHHQAVMETLAFAIRGTTVSTTAGDFKA